MPALASSTSEQSAFAPGFGWTLTTATVRWVLGLQFFMAGWWKCFGLGPPEHARRFFVEGYADSWIPTFLLMGLGVAIPVAELLAGAALCLGFRKREGFVAIAVILVIVTYGHLLAQPLFDTSSHIFPRLVLLVIACLCPPALDRLSIDWFLAHRRIAIGGVGEAT